MEASDLSAASMAACWNGKYGLNAETRESPIGIDKQLEQGGEPCPDEVREKLEKFGVKI
jgi:hypothetical protein